MTRYRYKSTKHVGPMLRKLRCFLFHRSHWTITHVYQNLQHDAECKACGVHWDMLGGM